MRRLDEMCLWVPWERHCVWVPWERRWPSAPGALGTANANVGIGHTAGIPIVMMVVFIHRWHTDRYNNNSRYVNTDGVPIVMIIVVVHSCYADR